MNIKNLHRRLTSPIEKFRKLGDTIDTEHGPLTYIDRGRDVLAVAPLDSVLFNENPVYTKQYNNYRINKCPQLDDRLGAWMCIDVLPRAGIKADVLLCDSEETGNSTAKYFEAPKQYNWICEFDRAGSDMVMYNYEDLELETIMESYAYEVGNGAFTDICELEKLNAKGFNFGVGYHAQHTEQCYANLSETFDSFRKFQTFYKDYKDIHFPHEEVEFLPYYYRGNNYSRSTYTTSYTPKKKAKKVVQRQTFIEEGMEDQYPKYEAEEYSASLDDWRDDVAEQLFGAPYLWLRQSEKDTVDTEISREFEMYRDMGATDDEIVFDTDEDDLFLANNRKPIS